jgi:uncharacterized membrane protein
MTVSDKEPLMKETTKDQTVVATYTTHDGAEAAVRALQVAGLDMKRLSIVGRDFQTEEHAVGFYTSGDRMMFWGARGAFWGSLWGMLFGGALFVIPAIGPVVAMGPLVGLLAGALEGAAIGGAAGVFGAALANIGVPQGSIMKYELDVKAGKFLVLAQGSADIVEHARVVLGTSGAASLSAHAA